MIDRTTAWRCAALIALMLALAVWRVTTLDGAALPGLQAGTTAPAWLMLVFPAASALVVGSLYWTGHRAAIDEAKAQPWRRWGASLALPYCIGLLLMQGLLMVHSLGLDIPLDLAALARAGGLVMALLALLAINRMPKLPWIETAFKVGGQLGPVYGPQYMRLQSRAVVLFMIAVIAWSVAVPPASAARSAVYVLLASAALVAWSIALRLHLHRKWKLDQQAGRGPAPP